MSAQTLFLIRALPGAGKTTLAVQLDLDVFEADQFFMDELGRYNFDPSKLPQAHAECRRQTLECLEAGKSCVVSNTFTQRWEMQPYIEMAEQTDTRLSVISLFDGGCTDEQLAERNTHGVPLQAIQTMRKRWEFDWKNGSPERLQPPAEVVPDGDSPSDRFVPDELRNVIDEIQAGTYETVPASPWKLLQYTSTPKTLDNTIERLWFDASMADSKNGGPEQLQPPAEAVPGLPLILQKKQHVIHVRIACNSEPVPGCGPDFQDKGNLKFFRIVQAAARGASRPLGSYDPIVIRSEIKDLKVDEKKQQVIDVRIVCNSEPVPGWGHDPQDMVQAAVRGASHPLGAYQPVVLSSEVKDFKIEDLTDSEVAAFMRHMMKEEVL